MRVPGLDRFGVPASGVKGVALNVTAVNPADAGWLRVWPCGSPEPSTSSVNYALAGAVEPNAVVEQNPLMEGKQMIMVFAPKKK